MFSSNYWLYKASKSLPAPRSLIIFKKLPIWVVYV